MQWAQISRNWEAFTPAIIDHWPDAEEDDVLALDGTATSLAMYLSEVTGEPATDTLAQVEDWRMGHAPTDVLMDETRDNKNISDAARHLGDGEDPYDRDDIFGAEGEAAEPMGRQ
ncbi:hypothetical protein [Pseudooceanicola atlanticus]|jgi:hypothetical protein|uniref:Uncharacterized protein n=1 Tax=Pseudooceanicola atlanticus TaxID=1461694 RepID=A0A0A0EBB7_9RHOB|nr:hypothetical protein [Pseudooceanicola atlanticus]KGM47754.1 hypothetical protein ATO9_16960 [Pseudooceanicola atlanticus]